MPNPPSQKPPAASQPQFDKRDPLVIANEKLDRHLIEQGIDPKCARAAKKAGKLDNIPLMPNESFSNAEITTLSEMCPLKPSIPASAPKPTPRRR